MNTDGTSPCEQSKAQAAPYQVRIVDAISALPASEWQELFAGDHPFTSFDFLDCLEQSGSIRAELGWQARHFLLYQNARLAAAAPMYVKGNSHGEFVFDHSWAATYHHYQKRYFPKLLIGVPYSPVTGPRLLAKSATDRQALILALEQFCQDENFSGLHINFLTDSDAAFLTKSDQWLPRFDWQFHWQKRPHWQSFQDFLADFAGKKRRNIQQERSKLSELGLSFANRSGSELSVSDWQAIHSLYVGTFEEKGNLPALTLDFFLEFARRQPESVRIFSAHSNSSLDADSMIAMALCFQDSQTLYGRYWGAHERFQAISGLHFECCYYRPIEYCLANNLQRFEPGAQGEHKLARGFLPTRVRSSHFIARADFRRAFRLALADEADQRNTYGEILARQSPYKNPEQ